MPYIRVQSMVRLCCDSGTIPSLEFIRPEEERRQGQPGDRRIQDARVFAVSPAWQLNLRAGRSWAEAPGLRT
jgi:hypothetical protein